VNRTHSGLSNLAAYDVADTEIDITGQEGVGNASNENLAAIINIFGPEATEYTYFEWSTLYRGPQGSPEQIQGTGARLSAADVDAIRFHWSAGNWAAQGKIQFLGIKN
jgi:hypothetical protein